MPRPSPPIPGGLILEPFRGLRFSDSSGRHTQEVARLTTPVGIGQGRYTAAGGQLQRWRADGTLRLDEQAGLYAYEMTSPGGRPVVGLLGALHLAPAAAGIVLPHEDTMPGPVAERLAALDALETDLEPIFLLYDGGPVAAEAITLALAGPGLIDIRTEDGTRHRVAAVVDPEQLTAVAAEMLPQQALIADGHHRYATYLAHQARHWADGSGPGPWDAGLAYLVDARRSGPRVRPIHRVLTELPFDVAVQRAGAAGRVRRLPPSSGASMLAELVAVSAGAVDGVPGPGHEATIDPGPAFVLASGSQGVILDRLDGSALAAAAPPSAGPALRTLDVTALHSYVIPDVLAVTDDDQTVRSDSDADDAVDVAQQAGGTAILLRPIAMSTVLDIAAAGERMPRKSTLFVPKPATGLVLRSLDINR